MARIGARSPTEVGATDHGTQGDTGENVIDPRQIIFTEEGGAAGPGGDDSGAEPGPGTGKKKGRPVGSVNKQKDKTLSVDGIVFSLTGIHALLAAALQAPELVLSQQEAEYVAKSYTAVARHYDMQASQKAVDIGNLVVTIGIVYGSRLVSIGARRKAARDAKRAGTPAVVVQPAPAAPPRAATGQPTVRAGGPNGAAPLTRPKSEADNAMLDEIPVPMFNAH